MGFLFCFIFSHLIQFGSPTENSLREEFDTFKALFGKQYTTSEEKQRFKHFKLNRDLSEKLKFQPHLGAKFGVTKFWDLSVEEFKDLYLSDILVHGNHVGNTETHPNRFKHLGIPDKLDWRTKLNHSVISPIKNQKKCGACWAFSTVETVESMYAIQTGFSVPLLSVQEVIDCADNNYGCRGGDTCRALQWMIDTKPALVQDNKYPLTDESNQCKIIADPSGAVYVHNSTCDNYAGKEDQILLLLQAGPVAAAVDATTWYNYQGGIIQYHCGVYDNHAVQIIGYDLTGDVPHYIIRNSWGTDFGNGGYIYVKIGENICGIANRISSVYVKV